MVSVAGFLKMGTLFGIFFCTIIISERMLIVQGAVYSTPDTALQFSQCLIEKMSESQFFTIDDRNSMIEVANVMSQALQNRRQRLFSGKILVVAFVTSMADVVITGDTASNSYRKGTYANALEQCSLSATGYVDVEFIREAMRILLSIEGSKVPKFEELGSFGGAAFSSVGTYESGMIPQGQGMLNPFAVQPSPVEVMFAPQFTPNVRTDYEPFVGSNPPLSSVPAQFALNPQPGFLPASEMSFLETGSSSKFGNVHIQPEVISSVQPGVLPLGTYESSLPLSGNIPVGSLESSMVQPGGIALDYDTSGISQSKSEFSGGSSVNIQTGDVVEGINVPQTKESSVVVIPPGNTQEDGNPAPGVDQTVQSYNLETVPEYQREEDSRTSPAILPQTDGQFSNISPSPTLEIFFFNILSNSNVFRNVFNQNIPQENAVNLARAITQQSLSGFDMKAVEDAVAAVADEVAKVSFNSPENYALALSNGLVSVLKLHNLPSVIDGSQLATSLLSSLEGIQQESSQTENVGKDSIDYAPGDEHSISSEERKTDFDFQNPPLSPEDVDEERFSLALSRALSDSEILSIFFCSSDVPVDRMQACFNMVKFSLIDFGPQISSIAASISSSALSELSGETLCLNYAKTMSEIIADVLDENGIHGANFEDISNKMAFNLQQQIPNIDSLKSTTISNVPTMNRLSTSYQTTPTLPYSIISKESTQFNPSQTPVMEKTQSDYQPNSLSTSPVTPAYSTEITDEEITTVMTLLSSSESSTTESPAKWAPDGVIDQEALTEYLSDAFESALESYNSKDTDEDVPNAPSASNASTTGTYVISDYSQPAVQDTTPSSAKGTSPGRVQDRRRKRKRKTTVSQSRTMTSPSVQTVDDQGDQSSQDQSDDNGGDRGLDQQSDYEISDGSLNGPPLRNLNNQRTTVELHPSFQGPFYQSTGTRDVSQTSSGTVTDTGYKDESIAFAKEVSEIAAAAINYIRTQEIYLPILCDKINKLAPIVDIPRLDYCEKTAAIDYLLNVISALTKKLKGV